MLASVSPRRTLCERRGARPERVPRVGLAVGGQRHLELLARPLRQADVVAVRRHDAAVEGRVELANRLFVAAAQPRHGLEGDRPGDLDRVEAGRRRRRDVEAVVLGRDGHLDGGQEAGDELRGLVGEVAAVAHLPEVLAALPLLDALDVALAAVVAGQGQVPVAEALVEVAQVAGGGAGGLLGVAALVDVAVDAQAVALAGAADELPRADRPGMGHGVDAEAALDDRQVGQLGRNAFLDQDPSDARQVLAAAIQGALHVGAHARLIPVDEVLHARVRGRELRLGIGWRLRCGSGPPVPGQPGIRARPASTYVADA